MVVISPAPDFSMPYNVITYSCTIIALFFGSMYNAYTRRYIPLVIEKDDEKKGDSKDIKKGETSGLSTSTTLPSVASANTTTPDTVPVTEGNE